MCVFNISYWVITIYITSFLLFWVETFPFKQFYSIPFYSRTTYVPLYFVLGNCFICHTKSWVLLHVLSICAILFPLPHGSFLFSIFMNLPASPVVPSPAFTSRVLPTLNKPHSERQIPFVSLIFRNWTSYMCIWMMYMRGNTPKGIMKMEDKTLRERQGREWEQNGLWRTDSISLWNPGALCFL